MGVGIVSFWMKRTKIEVAPNARLNVCEAIPQLSHKSSRRAAERKIYTFLGGGRFRWRCVCVCVCGGGSIVLPSVA